MTSSQKTKKCNGCGKRRKAKFFKPYVRADRRDTLSPRCRDCQRVKDRERWERRKQLKEDIEAGRALPAVNFLDVKPFREWLEATVPKYASLREFCESTGLVERRIYDMMNGRQKRVSLDTVDQALTRDGSAYLWELYPELYP